MSGDLGAETVVPTTHVEIKEICRHYGTITALHPVSSKIDRGEFVALLGPSGCGKTTLLRCIAGLTEPSGGQILIDGESITNVPVHKRRLGMVFQSYALFPHMNVSENVRFGLRMNNVGRTEADIRIDEALDLVQMRDFRERFPGQLSGGQQQRIALARALVTRPAVLLLDEPFGALDAKLRESMQIELRRLQRKLKVTTIFVTHDQDEALSMADRVVVMKSGRIEQSDSPDRIYDNPRTPFVAEFIGQMNKFRGLFVARSYGKALVLLNGWSEAVPALDNPDVAVGEEIFAMIRPERVLVGEPHDSRESVTFKGPTADLVFAGDKLSVYVDAPIGVTMATLPNVGRSSGDRPVIGDTLKVSWRWDDFLIFPASKYLH